jgi:hypothetical protein
MAELDRVAWTYGSCKANSIQHFYSDVTEIESKNNIAVEVEDISINTDPESLSIMLFQSEVGDEPPIDPNIDDADASATRALGKMYAIKLNYLQLTAGRLILTVQCGANDVRFRAVARLIHAELSEGAFVTGMMYPDAWVYHYFEVTAEMIAAHQNLRFEIIRHTGEVYMAFARQMLPPGFASNNEFRLAVDSSANWSTIICRPHEPEKVYYGLYGGEARAEYEVGHTQPIVLCSRATLFTACWNTVSTFA